MKRLKRPFSDAVAVLSVAAVLALSALMAIPAIAAISEMATAKLNITIGVDAKASAVVGPAVGDDVFSVLATTTYKATGTGAGTAPKVWDQERTIASAGADVINLSGSLTNRAGDSCVFTNYKVLFIQNKSATANLTIGGGTNPVLSVATVLAPGERLVYDAGATGAGKVVTASTAMNLTITSDANNAVYDILVGGQ